MKTFLRIFTVTLLLQSLPLEIYGQGYIGNNLLDCEETSHFKHHCVLNPVELGPNYCFTREGEEVCTEMTFKVQYQFPCTGHPLNFGITSGSNTLILEPTTEKRTVSLSGPGPFLVKDFSPQSTPQAAENLECSVIITQVESDLSPGTLQLLSEQLQSMRDGNMVFQNIKKLESLSNTTLTLLHQLDIPTTKTLLKSLLNRIELLKQSYQDPEAQTALAEIYNHVSSSYTEDTINDLESWKAEIRQSLDDLATVTATATDRTANHLARVYVYASRLLAMAAEPTITFYEPLFEEENRKAQEYSGEGDL